MGSARPSAGEFALIDWIRRQEPERPVDSWTRLGIGDDCAILGVGEGTGAGCDLLITTDMLMDGRHFRLEQDGPEAVGYKAMGVNLSDIAAMAGIPARRSSRSRCRGTRRSRSRTACTPGCGCWRIGSASTWSAATPTPGTARWSSRSPCWARRPCAVRCAARRAGRAT